MKNLSDKELVRILDTAVDNFKGDTKVLRAALGALIMGRRLGWKPL